MTKFKVLKLVVTAFENFYDLRLNFGNVMCYIATVIKHKTNHIKLSIGNVLKNVVSVFNVNFWH